MAQTTRRSASFGPDVTLAPGRSPFTTERPGRATRLGADFEEFVSSLRRAIVPASPLESILADRLILAAWRLQLASTLEFNTALAGEELAPLSREAFEAESSLGMVLELLESSRAARLGRDLRPAPEIFPTNLNDDGPLNPADSSNEWPTLPNLDEDADDESEEDIETPAAPRWQDRLVFDFSVSETSPVVKGTWVTVGHVVSLIVDGWIWSDVLRSHPELTEDDIRTCLAYSIEHDNTDAC